LVQDSSICPSKIERITINFTAGRPLDKNGGYLGRNKLSNGMRKNQRGPRATLETTLIGGRRKTMLSPPRSCNRRASYDLAGIFQKQITVKKICSLMLAGFNQPPNKRVSAARTNDN